MSINEAVKRMEDKNLLKYVEDCVNTLKEAGFDATMDDIDCVVNESTTAFGSMSCKKSVNGNYTLTLSNYLKDEPEDTIKNTIYHELCHYLQFKYNFSQGYWWIDGAGGVHFKSGLSKQLKKDTLGHGKIWKTLAAKVGALTNQNITRTDTYETHASVGKAYDDKVKYIVRCEKCGNELTYTRSTEFVKDPNIKVNYWSSKEHKVVNDYKWSCGYCKAKGQWKVITRK